ncbi:hypothetical protein [Pseudomonas savastanoi]|uniref:hypothetical protein n=1 Tax=Pseudomonas savastanoi TaxID=29438 RepID=UPI000E329BFE|nr:hypothetical protein [Pseudomonas savastanoi]
MLTNSNHQSAQQDLDQRLNLALAKLQLPYKDIVEIAGEMLRTGIPMLKLVCSRPESVYRLADAVHAIPKSMSESSVDQLRLRVAEAMVAIDELNDADVQAHQ